MNKKIFLAPLFLFPVISFGANFTDVRINEFLPQPTSGSGWVELINSSSSDINLAGWTIGHLNFTEESGTTTSREALGGLIPRGGLVSFDIDLRPEGDQLILSDEDGALIHGVSYGDAVISTTDSFDIPPSLGQSAITASNDGGFWTTTDMPSHNWFNQSPTKTDILDTLPAGVSSNLDVSSDWTILGDIIFSREGFEPVIWTGPHNLTGAVERAEFARLGTELVNRVVLPVLPSSGGGGGGGGSPTASGGVVATPVDPLIGLVLGTSTSRRPFTFSRILRPGMRGPDVQELQKILQRDGFFKAQITTYFGPLTSRALSLWQKKNNIRPATGVAGKPTLRYLNLLGSLDG